MSETSENTDTNTRGKHLWKPGQSGNPAGKPRGARHKITVAIQSLLEGQAEAITQKAIDAAMEGDTTALRLCLERILPASKEIPVRIDLPSMESISDLPKVTAALIAAVSSGEILPGEAEKLGKLIDNHRAALEIADLDVRLKALEDAQVVK